MKKKLLVFASTLIALILGFVGGVAVTRQQCNIGFSFHALIPIHKYYEAKDSSAISDEMDRLYHIELSSLFRSSEKDWWHNTSKYSLASIVLDIIEQRKADGLPAFSPEKHFFEGRMDYRENLQAFLDLHRRKSNK